MIDNGRSPALLPSERVIVAAPLSLAGSAERAWRLAIYPHGDGWMAAARERAAAAFSALPALSYVAGCGYVPAGYRLMHVSGTGELYLEKVAS